MTDRQGESAISIGAMVPVLASNDDRKARAALTILEDHGIPAVVDTDLGPVFFGLHEPVPEGWRQVLVPSSMRSTALEILRREETEVRRARPPGAHAPFEAPRPGGRGPRPPGPPPALPSRTGDVPSPSRTPGSSRSPEPPLGWAGLAPGDEPDPGGPRHHLDRLPVLPTATRLTWALLAIAGGMLVQRVLETGWGRAAVFEALAARAPLLEELHRLVTAGFLHSGAGHMLSNAAFGIVFGVVVFGTHLPGAAAATWLLGSMVGFSAELGLDPAATVVGASAGNYALVGLWARGQLERSRLEVLPRRELLKTLGILLLLVPGALTPFSSTGSRIAVLAHVGGFFAGYLAGLLFRRRLLLDQLKVIEARSRVAGAVALSVVLAGWSLGLLRLLDG